MCRRDGEQHLPIEATGNPAAEECGRQGSSRKPTRRFESKDGPGSTQRLFVRRRFALVPALRSARGAQAAGSPREELSLDRPLLVVARRSSAQTSTKLTQCAQVALSTAATNLRSTCGISNTLSLPANLIVEDAPGSIERSASTGSIRCPCSSRR